MNKNVICHQIIADILDWTARESGGRIIRLHNRHEEESRIQLFP